MEKVKTRFLQTQRFKPLVWLRYIYDIFFIRVHGKETLNSFVNNFDYFKFILSSLLIVIEILPQCEATVN